MTCLVDLVRSHPWTTEYIMCVILVAAIVERVTLMDSTGKMISFSPA